MAFLVHLQCSAVVAIVNCPERAQFIKFRSLKQAALQSIWLFQESLITEKLPQSLNTQYEMEALFHKRLPNKVKALCKWKSVDVQRINPEEPDYRRISSYLGKQTNLELIALDAFNSDLSPQKK